MRMSWLGTSVSLALLGQLVAHQVEAAPVYQARRLPIAAVSVNSEREVLGLLVDSEGRALGTDQQRQYGVWSEPNGIIQLQAPSVPAGRPNASSSSYSAQVIGEDGRVYGVGTWDYNSFRLIAPLRWSDGVPEVLGFTGDEMRGLSVFAANRDGLAVATFNNGNKNLAAVLTGETWRPARQTFSGGNDQLYDINDSGLAVGFASFDSNAITLASTYTVAGGFHQLSSVRSVATAISANGNIVGFTGSIGPQGYADGWFLKLNESPIQHFQNPAGERNFFVPAEVLDDGVVIGRGSQGPVIWRAELGYAGFIDFLDESDPDILSEAMGLTQLAPWGTSRRGDIFYGQLLFALEAPPNPVPLPTSVWLLGSALAGVMGLVRRRAA